ncbi:MAG: class aldolase/adducin family protein [Actinomycetia bacterium]|nr:class aldolase/adducin family protein [Actinomycetes bacterium]
MTAIETDLLTDFVAQATADAEHGFRVLRETGTLSANGTVAVAERVPGTDRYVVLRSPGPWALDPSVEPQVLGLEGGDDFGFGRLLLLRPELTTVVHVHSPYLGAWSQTHRDLPIRYVPVQRWTLGSVIPTYTDRTRSQIDFILDRLEEDPHTPAILEANGGATVWGSKGLLPTLEYVQLVEEGAQFQILAEALGGSQPVGPGVLEQQWRMSGLLDQARAEGKLP